jgi:hypothetical protein
VPIPAARHGQAQGYGCTEIVGIRFRSGLFAGGRRIRTIGPAWVGDGPKTASPSFWTRRGRLEPR